MVGIFKQNSTEQNTPPVRNTENTIVITIDKLFLDHSVDPIERPFDADSSLLSNLAGQWVVFQRTNQVLFCNGLGIRESLFSLILLAQRYRDSCKEFFLCVVRDHSVHPIESPCDVVSSPSSNLAGRWVLSRKLNSSSFAMVLVPEKPYSV